MKPKLGRGDEYFAVNDKTCGVRTSYRVSGRRGELGKRFWSFDEAWKECKRLNKAYQLGLTDGVLGVVFHSLGEREKA
jgi:hypothetical protein